MKSFDLFEHSSTIPLGHEDDRRQLNETLFRFAKGTRVVYRKIAHDYSGLRLYYGIIDGHEQHCGWPIENRSYVLDDETGLRLTLPAETPASASLKKKE